MKPNGFVVVNIEPVTCIGSDPKQKDVICCENSHASNPSTNHIFKVSCPNNGQSPNDDLYSGLRVFLLLGKFIGVLNIQGLFQSDFRNLKFRKTSCAAITTMMAILLVFINTAMGFLDMLFYPISSVLDVWTITIFLFNAGAVAVFIYFYRHSLDLIEIFHDWKNMRVYFTRPDTRLFRDVNLITGIVMGSAILENLVWHATLFHSEEETHLNATRSVGDAEPWAKYRDRSYDKWLLVVPIPWVSTFLIFLSNKLALYCWNYMDLCIVVLARAMYFKFKTLSLFVKTALLEKEANQDVFIWRQLAKDHQTLRAILDKINGFLSPLIFLSYGDNIYWIINHIHYGFGYLDTHGDDLIILYKYWSLLHIALRIILVNTMAANVNYWAHDVTKTFINCPDELYVSQVNQAFPVHPRVVKRAERFISTNTIGLSGLNCFTITKPLLLQIFGVIFTVEAVLIQSSQGSGQASTNC